MVLEALVLAVIAGYLLRGRLQNLAYLTWRWPLLFVIGVIWQRLPFLLVDHWPVLGAVLPWLYMSSYILLLAAVALNWREPAFRLIGMGLLLNLLVIAANEGRMPVSPEAVARAGLPPLPDDPSVYVTSPHTRMDADTRLWFLGDVFPVSIPYRRPRVISIGDLLLAAGIVWLVVRGMRAGGIGQAVGRVTRQTPGAQTQ
ncbi:MAG: DUF5317 domain-containing protein [Limnochordales bacterium]|nr:DUF5317 domain-containing protein [Limnochordales bacterium]